MSRKIPDNQGKPYTMDVTGKIIYPEPPTPAPRKQAIRPVSIDELLQKGLQTVQFIMRSCMDEANPGPPSRESVMNLKDCMAMLKDLKAQEDALLEGMTDEQIEQY